MQRQYLCRQNSRCVGQRGVTEKFSIKIEKLNLSNEIFDLQFFSLFEPTCATDQWVKIFSIVVKISLSYSNLGSVLKK